jgi:ankyrin repeat protein
VRKASEQCVLTLLEFKGDPNQTCGQAKSTPLLLVAGHVPNELAALGMARGLLDAKASINYSNLFDQTPLFSCASRDDQVLMAYYVSRGAKVNHWNKVFGKSLLMEFFTNGALDGKKLTTLIDAGAELHPTERQRVLHLAAAQQNDEVLRIVLDKTGAGKPHIEARNEVGETTLHLVCAAREPSIDAMRVLLQSNADVEIVNGKGQSPLVKCVESNIGPSAIQFLLSQRADPNHASPTNTTALIKCCREWPEPRDVIEALLRRGASINHQENVTRASALHALAERDDMDSQGVLASGMMLLRHGANVSLKNSDGRIPLHQCYASCARLRKGVHGGPFLSLLLSHAGEDDVYCKDNSGNAPRDLYEEPPDFEYADGEHLGVDSLRAAQSARDAARRPAHATTHGFAHATVGKGVAATEKEQQQHAQGASHMHHSSQAQVPKHAGRGEDAGWQADGTRDGDDGVDEYLATIRARAGQLVFAPKAGGKGPKGQLGGGGGGGGDAQRSREEANALGWSHVQEHDVIPPAPIAEETLLSLRRPAKGPLLRSVG